MNPAWSVVLFTTLAGIGQGVVMAVAAASLFGAGLPAPLTIAALGTALVLLVVALAASFLHLGRPERAWRAVLMWRTSWLSREVIVLPAFIALVGLWLGLHLWGAPGGLRAAAPVLLVDDHCDSGWTLTVATRLLREAGATAVLPLVLAVPS